MKRQSERRFPRSTHSHFSWNFRLKLVCYTSIKEPYCLNVISLYIENSEYGVSACISVSPPVVQSAAHSSGTQRRRWLSLALHTWLRDSAKKVAEFGSSHMAQGLSEEDGWVWLFTQDATRTPGLSVGQDWVWLHNRIYTEKGRQLTCWATSFLWAWILVSLWVVHQRSLLLWFHLQLSILLCEAASHIEFLIAGRKAVLMTFTIAALSRYTSGPLTQPFLVC